MIRGLKKDVETGSDEIPKTVQKNAKVLEKIFGGLKKRFYLCTHAR